MERHILAENRAIEDDKEAGERPHYDIFDGGGMLDAFCLFEKLESDFVAVELKTTRKEKPRASNQMPKARMFAEHNEQESSEELSKINEA